MFFCTIVEAMPFNFLLVLSLVLCYNKFFSSVLHYAKIKCQVLPILDYKWCHSYMELLFLLAAVHRFIFNLILVTHKITKLKLWVKIFVLCNSLKFQIFLTCLSSPIKYVFLLLFFWTDSVFCCKNHFFISFNLIIFESLEILWMLAT